MSYHHVPSPAISHISRAAVLSKEVTHSSLSPWLSQQGFAFHFLGEELSSRTHFQAMGQPSHLSQWPYNSQKISLIAAELEGMGGQRGEELWSSVSDSSRLGLFFIKYRTAIVIISYHHQNQEQKPLVFSASLRMCTIIRPARVKKTIESLTGWGHQNHLVQTPHLANEESETPWEKVTSPQPLSEWG